MRRESGVFDLRKVECFDLRRMFKTLGWDSYGTFEMSNFQFSFFYT